ncbi:hypothetical protein [Streptomyces badius]|nr:hypothetical protein [Streptomyces badius]
MPDQHSCGKHLRPEEQEVELLTLAWFTDHADPERAAQGAQAASPRQPG